jgi:hypothetical protein
VGARDLLREGLAHDLTALAARVEQAAFSPMGPDTKALVLARDLRDTASRLTLGLTGRHEVPPFAEALRRAEGA